MSEEMAKKKWGELPTPVHSDIIAPFAYLLYRKGILSENEYIKFVNSYTTEPLIVFDMLNRIDSFLK